MGSKGSTTTTSSAPPQAVQDMYQYLMQQGKALQQQPYQAYQGTLVPDVNPTQQAAVNQSTQYSQAAQPYLSQAGQMTQQAAAGYNPQNYAQGVAGYMSPYMQQAMGATAAQMNNINQQQQQQLLGDTIKQGAFGGDRGQIAQAALMNQQNLATGNVLANMANTGYNAAAANYMAGLGAQGQLANQYGNIGNLAQTAGMTGAAQLGTAGGIPYAVQQAQNAANYQQYAQQQAYPMQTLGFLANMASGLGAGQGGTSATTQPGGNIMSQVLGLGTAFLTSDERAKDNMEPVGKTFDGQNIYRYNYKGSPTTQLGLSAQEVEKHNPDAVAKDNNGMRMVDYSQATSDAADKGHFAAGGSSQGGLVPSSLERHPFATSGCVGYGMIPFEDDPLTQEMALLSKLSLGSWVPKLAIEGGKGVGIPEAPTPEKQDMADVTSLGNFGSALYKKGGAYVTNNLAKATAGSSFKNPTSDYWTYASGGLVPRVPHADGEAADPTIDKTVRSLGDVGSQVGNFVNGLRSTDTEPGLIGNLFNAGKPLDEAARFGIMSAGLAVAADPSQNVLQAIGRGGLTGANAYSNRLKAQNEYNQKLAEQALKGREIDVSSRLADIQAQTLGLKTFEDLKQMYNVVPDPDPTHADSRTGVAPLMVYGIHGQQIPFSVYLKDLTEIARSTHMPIESLIREHVQSSSGSGHAGHASGGRTHHAIGGLAGGMDGGLAGNFEDTVPFGSVSDKPSNNSFNVDGLIRSALQPPEKPVFDSGVPKIKLAQAASSTQTDGVEKEQLDPNLQQILDYQKQAKDIEKFLAANPNFSNEQKTILNSKANDYRTKAQELSGREYSTDTNVKYRWQYGATQKPNEPPAPLAADAPHAVLDPDTGAIKTVAVDIGYPETKGYPTSKLPKHAVKVGDDPVYNRAVEQSVPLENAFLEQSQNTQEAITSLAKFSAASKAIESKALMGDRTKLAAILKSLGFDDIATAVAGAADPAQAQILTKTAIDSAVTKVSSAFAQPTQSEFHLIENKASPNLDTHPQANFSLSKTQLGAAMWQDKLRHDWLEAKSQGAQNFLAYQALWKRQNNRQMYEDSAERLLGNYAGQELPSVDKLVSGGVYVVPAVKKGETLSGLKDYLYTHGFTAGDVVTIPRVNHYKDADGKMKVDFDEPSKVS